jgi:adenylosuccinate lyase
MSDNNPLLNLSPIDGRYRNKTRRLSNYFSEFALFQYRVEVEVKYFIFLFEKVTGQKLPYATFDELKNIYKNFNLIECEKIREIERKTRHDVKAVEYYLAERFKLIGIYTKSYLIHFGLTSQDINNTSVTMSIKDFMTQEFIPSIRDLLADLNEKSQFWRSAVMMSRTHGQPAVPTTMGKEFRVFHYRIEKQLRLLENVEYYGKFGGAVGNLNAHCLAYPDIDWTRELDTFVNECLGLTRERYTSQIDNYENLAVIFDNTRRINTILVDMARDIWQYISMDYLVQEFNPDETGSSTMPQKINPIDFENAEGNLMIASSLLDFMSNKLPISRLQRDLTDSTVLRNLGTIFGHITIAISGLRNGLGKININPVKLHEDLDNHIEVITEGVQTLLRREGFLDAYEQLKGLSRNNERLSYSRLHEFIQTLDISEETKQQLYSLTPFNYVGVLHEEINSN